MNLGANSIPVAIKRFASLLKLHSYQNHQRLICSFDRKDSSSSFISIRYMKVYHQFIKIESKPFQSILAKSYV